MVKPGMLLDCPFSIIKTLYFHSFFTYHVYFMLKSFVIYSHISVILRRTNYYNLKTVFSEAYICPSGYFKCRNSFCLESRFVCDGETQCLTGEDERGCGTVLIITQDAYSIYSNFITVTIDFFSFNF